MHFCIILLCILATVFLTVVEKLHFNDRNSHPSIQSLTAKSNTIQPKNKKSSQNKFSLSRGERGRVPFWRLLNALWIDLAHLHHEVVIKGKTTRSRRWAVRKQSFRPCAVFCQTRDACVGYNIKVTLDQQDPFKIRDLQGTLLLNFWLFSIYAGKRTM